MNSSASLSSICYGMLGPSPNDLCPHACVILDPLPSEASPNAPAFCLALAVLQAAVFAVLVPDPVAVAALAAVPAALTCLRQSSPPAAADPAVAAFPVLSTCPDVTAPAVTETAQPAPGPAVRMRVHGGGGVHGGARGCWLRC